MDLAATVSVRNVSNPVPDRVRGRALLRLGGQNQSEYIDHPSELAPMATVESRRPSSAPMPQAGPERTF